MKSRFLQQALLLCTLSWNAVEWSVASAWDVPPDKGEWTIRATPTAPSGIALVGEKADIQVLVTKRSEDAREVSLVAKVQAPGEEAREERWPLSFKSAGKEEVSLSLPTAEAGYWSIQFQLLDGSKELARKQSALAVVEKPVNYGQLDKRSFFGSMFNRDAEAAQRIGIKFERQQAVWEWLSPAKGEYRWDGLDERIANLNRHGISVVLVIRPEIPPKWAPWKSVEQLTEPEFLPLFHDFTTQLVERYKDRIAGLEVVNEPDLECARGASGNVAIPEIYARLLRTAYKASKAVAPELPVLALDVSGVDFPSLAFSRRTLDLTSDALDIIAGHPYASSRYLGGGAQAQSPDAIDTRSRFLAMAELLQKHGIKPRIWSTEFGWGLHKEEALNSPATELHAAYAAQAITLARSVPEVEKLFWFSMFFPGYEGGFTYGMFHGTPPEAYPIPTAAAYATCARLLDNVKFAKSLPLGHFGTIWRFNEAETGDAVFVGWLSDPRAAGGEARMTLTQAERALCTVTDAYGRVVKGDPVFSALPLFLRAPAAEADRIEHALQKAELAARETLLIQSLALEDVSHVGLQIINNSNTPTAVKIFQTGKPETARSRSLRPGSSEIRLEIPPVEGAGELSFTLLEESSGKTRSLTLPHNLMAIPFQSGSAQGLAVEVKSRADVLPPDPGIEWNGPDDLSLQVRPSWTGEGLQLAVQVRDDVMVQARPDGHQFWSKDSLQIAWDMSNRAETGYDSHSLEIGVFSAEDGAKVAETFPNSTLREDIRADIQRREGTTSYQILIPWSALGVDKATAGLIFRMNIIANDNDGLARKCWIGLSPGIGEGKHPGAFRQWLLKPAKATSFPKATPSASSGASHQNQDASN